MFRPYTVKWAQRRSEQNALTRKESISEEFQLINCTTDDCFKQHYKIQLKCRLNLNNGRIEEDSLHYILNIVRGKCKEQQINADQNSCCISKITQITCINCNKNRNKETRLTYHITLSKKYSKLFAGLHDCRNRKETLKGQFLTFFI
jgi:hypothetical protein